MPMTSDFEGLAQMYDVARPTEGEEDVRRSLQILQQQIDRLNDLSTRKAAEGKANETPVPAGSIKFNSDGTIDISKLSFDQFQNYIGAQKFQQEVLGGFDIEARKLEAQQTRAEGQPWQQLATALSANLAMAPDMPGWVQGLGRTAAQLNPTVEQLRAQRLGVLAKGSDIAGKSAAIQVAQQRNLIEMQQLAMREVDRQSALENQREDDFGKYVQQEASRAAALRTFDESSVQRIAASAKQFGRSDARLASAIDSVRAAAEGGMEVYKQRQEEIEREIKVRAAEQVATAKAMIPVEAAKAKAVEQARQSVTDPMIDRAAKALVGGNLSSIRDISSFRGDQRLRLFDRIQELDPKFNFAELNRKIKMVDLYTTGKQGDAMQFYGTFLEHAGEVTETIKGINLTNSRLANKTLNWWRKNMTDSPEYARLKTSLEPVGIEFERFLIGTNYALQKQDRERIEALVSGDLPLNMVAATLAQMGKTAKDRFNEINYRYKRTVGEDIPLPFSPEATSGAAQIGLDVGAQPKSSKTYPWSK